MSYNSPLAEPIMTNEFCDYRCGEIARYQFRNGKLCCSAHFNSCSGKRSEFSSRSDHKENAAKSLATRISLGITKSSQVKATITRKANGHYENLAKKMQQHWKDNPWNNNHGCPILQYKNTALHFQGTYESEFLEEMEDEFGLDWLIENVRRGPSIWYIDPIDNSKRLYISDFIIKNTIYEIKSGWTWNKNGKDDLLEKRNKAKLSECILQGYDVILVLNQKRITYAEIMG